MRNIAIVFLIFLALVLAPRVSVAQTEPRSDEPKEPIPANEIGDGIVVPGDRIGPLKLGMTIAQMLRVMPSGYRRDVFEKESVIVYEWRREGVWVSLEEKTRAVRLVSVFGTGAYKTDKGVALLHTESRMATAYGTDFKRYEYPEHRLTIIRYVPLGLQFGVANYPSQKVIHGRIFAIGIFTPGKEPSLTLRPTK